MPYLYFETWDLTSYHRACDDLAQLDFPNLIQIGNTDASLKAGRGMPAQTCGAQ